MSENPDIVVLDDPISSFDKNKKFAILHELFHGRASLRGRTTLLLTHDLEPAIDLIKSTGHFEGVRPNVSFLSSSRGVVREIAVQSSDIQTFAQICDDLVTSIDDDLIRCIYLRRHFEILNNKGLEYNMLASLFKRRSVPTVRAAGVDVEMSSFEIEQAEEAIRSRIPGFSYKGMLEVVSDDSELRAKYHRTLVGYEKIQLFRIIRGRHDNDVITKFINESYHIENEYLMQLNPHKFEAVPEYVVHACDELLS